MSFSNWWKKLTKSSQEQLDQARAEEAAQEIMKRIQQVVESRKTADTELALEVPFSMNDYRSATESGREELVRQLIQNNLKRIELCTWGDLRRVLDVANGVCPHIWQLGRLLLELDRRDRDIELLNERIADLCHTLDMAAQSKVGG